MTSVLGLAADASTGVILTAYAAVIVGVWAYAKTRGWFL